MNLLSAISLVTGVYSDYELGPLSSFNNHQLMVNVSVSISPVWFSDVSFVDRDPVSSMRVI